MKIQAINNQNFSGIKLNTKSLTKTAYAAMFSASLLSNAALNADSFTKNKKTSETEIVNNVQSKQQAENGLDMMADGINELIGAEEGSIWGGVLLLLGMCGAGFLYQMSKNDD